MSEKPNPNLGYATTRELIAELAARIEVDGSRPVEHPDDDTSEEELNLLSELEVSIRTRKALDYRTVDEES